MEAVPQRVGRLRVRYGEARIAASIPVAIANWGQALIIRAAMCICRSKK
jgi:hypothetical protein